MMVWSINLFVLAVGILIVGMIKPQWILFWMEKPIRMPIVILSALLFMVAAVMFGEANREKQVLAAKNIEKIIEKKSDAVLSVVAETVKEEVGKEEKQVLAEKKTGQIIEKNSEAVPSVAVETVKEETVKEEE